LSPCTTLLPVKNKKLNSVPPNGFLEEGSLTFPPYGLFFFSLMSTAGDHLRVGGRRVLCVLSFLFLSRNPLELPLHFRHSGLPQTGCDHCPPFTFYPHHALDRRLALFFFPKP